MVVFETFQYSVNSETQNSLVLISKSIFEMYWRISSVIRQKGESQNECSKKTKHTKFFEKFMCIRACAYQGVRNVRLSENLACFFDIL